MPLGIELKSEQKYEDMVDILASLHKYVPTVTTIQKATLPEESTEVICDEFFPITLGMHTIVICAYIWDMHVGCILHTCVGGDQMTAARVRGSQRIRSNSKRGVDRLQGLVCVTEDWHMPRCASLWYVT